MSAVSHSTPEARFAAPMPSRLKILTSVTVAALILGLVLALVLVGPDSTQGDVQRLFYIHMPSFFGAFFAFAAAVVGGSIGGLPLTRDITHEVIQDSPVVVAVQR